MPAFRSSYLTSDEEERLSNIAHALIAPGKGILAADESPDTMVSRFECIGMESTEENRRRYRELLLTSGEEMSDYISGVILHHETFYQKTKDGVPFVKVLTDRNVIPGVKVNTRMSTLLGTDNESTSQGLDGLAERCAQYKKDGALFTKWRCTLKISGSTPSLHAISENANLLGRYACICQQNGLVAMLEPEVLYDGDHDLDTAQNVTEQVFAFVYKALNDHHVFLEGTLLKPNIVTAGQGCERKYTPEQNARATILALSRTVPAAVPGVVFLSGGHSEEDSTLNLNALNVYPGCKPWTLTFAFGRALQASVVKTWKGDDTNKNIAQQMFLERAKANSLATKGCYKGEMTNEIARESLFSLTKID